MPEPAIDRPTKLPSLDIGRFCAAFLVVLFHMGITVDNFLHVEPFAMAFQGGHSGVSYFFVLSGFIIVYVHRGDIGMPERIGEFARKRIVRIVPLLWLTMIGWGAIRLFLPGGTGNALQPLAILWDCLLLPHDSESVIGAVWTLRREMIFYALFAVLMIGPRTGIVLLVLWQFGTVVQAIHPFFDWGPEPRMLFGVHNLGFGLGMVLALLVPRRPFANGGVLIVAGVIGYAAMMVFEWRWERSGLPLGEVSITLAYLAASAVIVAGMVSRDILVPGRISRIGARLGDSSYALYLTQGPIGSVAIRVLKPIWPLVSAEVLMLMLAIITVAAAIVINEFVEKPVMRMLRARRARPVMAAAG